MIVDISSDAEEDLIDGYWFYERQSPGLGDYFRSVIIHFLPDSQQPFFRFQSITH